VGRKKEKWKNGLLALSEGENAEYKITIAKKKNNCKTEKSRNMEICIDETIHTK
jgi:hypothetical protein